MMKCRYLSLVLAVLAGTFHLYAQEQPDGHMLTPLWKQYEAASKADLPQKEADILKTIKEEALSRRLPVDFYDAATRYVTVVQRRDWKQRSALLEGLEQEVKAFDEAIVSFLWMAEWAGKGNEELLRFVQAQGERLQSRHPALYRSMDSFLGGGLKPFLASDREFALWYLLLRRSDDAAQKVLESELAGRYPNAPALEFYRIGRRYWPREQQEELRKAYRELAERHAGQAFSIYPRAELLRLRFASLTEEKAGEAAFRSLYEDARALVGERNACKGEDKLLVKGCGYPSELAALLSGSGLSLAVERDKATVFFRNLDRAALTLRRDKETLQIWQLENSGQHFYVPDSVEVALPSLEDGEYSLDAVQGKLSATARYAQYRLSLATRRDSRGRCVYVADYESGIPLRSVTLVLLRNGKEVATTTLRLHGFTPLPEAFLRKMDEKESGWTLQAREGKRLSRTVYLDRYDDVAPNYEDRLRCSLFKDRGAYHPGDTLHFKAIVYEGDPARSLKVVGGRKVTLRLHDSEDHILATEELTTNAWGSVCGQFVIPTRLRGGRFELEAEGLAYDWFRVDEFVLPSFDLSFDSLDRLYLAGDTVRLGGVLQSFSGHTLDGARIGVKVTRNGDAVLDTVLSPGQDGHFETAFKTSESGYYRADVRVTERSGETHVFSQGWWIGDWLAVSAEVENAADANVPNLVTEAEAKLRLRARDGAGNALSLPVRYTLSDASGKRLCDGEVPSGEQLSLTLPSDGSYLLKLSVSAFKADGSEVRAQNEVRLHRLLPDSRKLSGALRSVFISGPATLPSGDAISARLGTGEGDAYALVTLYGENRRVLSEKTLRVVDGSVEMLSLPYADAYPDAVRLQIFYFIQGRSVEESREYRREKDSYTLPLSITRFCDKAYPDAAYSFRLRTAPLAEVLVAAWDKSLDAIARNEWPLVSMRDFSVEGVPVRSACGSVGGGRVSRLDRGMYLAKSAVTDEAIPFQLVEQKPSFGAWAAEVPVREKFASALTFQPQLLSGADGTLDVHFRTSDKLSTYYVCVYAHDKEMHNAMVQQEIRVSLPVKVSLQEPRYLYEGDVYDAVVTLSSVADVPVSGMLRLSSGAGVQAYPVTVEPGAVLSRSFRCHAERGEQVLTASFVSDEFSDAVRVRIPVYPAAQQLSEAHSAVLHDGGDREALLSELRSRFVNVPASDAALREITVLDMVREVLSSHVEARGNDVLSLSEAWYVQKLCASVLSCDAGQGEASLLPRILACRNADGGFGWFEGMPSNPSVTAVLLERFARLRSRGVEVPEMAETVAYLDASQFGEVQRCWRGSLSDAQYMYVRSLYAEQPFARQAVTSAQKKRAAQFAKDAKASLLPSGKDGRGLQGRILAKARRLLTLHNLLEREGGLSLAKAWGISMGTRTRLQASMKADLASLQEYAVEHRDGGWYYPNAVLPWRGLQESEAYAHALLCQLPDASPVIADGIRLWLMLQKETQHWEAEPAFVDAVTAILDGSEAVLNTRVLALSASYEAPFGSIKASGNGFTLERRFLRDGVELHNGDTLHVGERISAEYRIWNAENRSFVKLTAAREAALTPVRQLSGHIGHGIIRPLRSAYVWSFYPQGYRHVKADATEYYFDSYPEEYTTLTEDFFVERAGCFAAPVVTIESLYAPHYRANDAFVGPLLSQKMPGE